MSDYILKPSDVTALWSAPRLKQELVAFFQELYKPASKFEEEKVEYNQINILAEYQQYNLIYAKNELLFDDVRAAMFLDMFWKLLEFDQNSNIQISQTNNKEAAKAEQPE